MFELEYSQSNQENMESQTRKLKSMEFSRLAYEVLKNMNELKYFAPVHKCIASYMDENSEHHHLKVEMGAEPSKGFYYTDLLFRCLSSRLGEELAFNIRKENINRYCLLLRSLEESAQACNNSEERNNKPLRKSIEEGLEYEPQLMAILEELDTRNYAYSVRANRLLLEGYSNVEFSDEFIHTATDSLNFLKELNADSLTEAICGIDNLILSAGRMVYQNTLLEEKPPFKEFLSLFNFYLDEVNTKTFDLDFGSVEKKILNNIEISLNSTMDLLSSYLISSGHEGNFFI